jgi:hypothetical protein
MLPQDYKGATLPRNVETASMASSLSEDLEQEFEVKFIACPHMQRQYKESGLEGCVRGSILCSVV